MRDDASRRSLGHGGGKAQKHNEGKSENRWKGEKCLWTWVAGGIGWVRSVVSVVPQLGRG